LTQPELAAVLTAGGRVSADQYDWDKAIIPTVEKYLLTLQSARTAKFN